MAAEEVLTSKEVFTRPFFKMNPIMLQVLGVCSSLAVTSSMQTALIMAISVSLVTACSSFLISCIRNWIRSSAHHRADDHHRVSRYRG